MKFDSSKKIVFKFYYRMIPESILKRFFCVLDLDVEHILENPIVLTCGHDACMECIGDKKAVKCLKCEKWIFINSEKMNENDFLATVMSTYIRDLFFMIEQKFKEKYPELNGY